MNRRSKGLTTAAACIALSLTVVGGAASPAAADTDFGNYEKLLITKDTGEPIDLAVLPDGRVLHTARNGQLRLTDATTGVTRVTNTIDVYANSEDGLQTVAVDPAFATNKWVYLYYAPRTMRGNAQNGQPYPTTTPTGNAPDVLPAGADAATYWQQWVGYNQLSRFTWDDATNSLDLTTEQRIISVEVQRGQCCHVAGDIDWDAAGRLYLATGDNTPASTPGANGMAPNNNAPGENPGHDDRRGAGNTNDLRGKILRIEVQADGSYTIPSGNLFPVGTAQTRPETFVMGLRNPFRMEVDPRTNSLSWGDYGPDAGAAIANRGPMGYVEWQMTGLDTPINGGWPYCHGPNANYNEWDYATATPGPFFDCAAGAVNTSTLNTGLRTLPPATAPQLWYGDLPGQQPRDELVTLGTGTGQSPMGGPIYHAEDYPDSPVKFPAYWNDKVFMPEFSQDYVAALSGDWPNGAVSTIEDFLPNPALTRQGQPIWDNVMDMEFGPDGSLWVLEYGDGFFRQNPDAGLYKVNYAVGNKTPQAAFTATPVSGSTAPLTVQFDASASTDFEPGALTYEWDFDGNGSFDATGVTASSTYTTLGSFTARLRVTDSTGRAGLTSRSISVGNQAPTVNITTPPNGGFFDWGQSVPFTITTNDAEEGTATVCSRVTWQVGLGHAAHAHPLTLGSGCTGSWLMPADAPQHGTTENVYGVVVVTYTDAGSNGLPGATGSTTLVLNPKTQQAEHADQLNGVTVTQDATAGGGARITSFDAGDSLVWDPVDFRGITGLTTRATGAGTLSLRFGSATAAPFATVVVPAGTGPQEVTTPLSGLPTGSGSLHVTSSGGVEVDQFAFTGSGVADVTGPTVVATPTPATPDGANGWYTSGPVTVNLAYSDASGLVNASRQYRIVPNANQCGAADGTWLAYPTGGNVVVSAQGTSVICYRGTDAAGNVTTGSFTVRIDSSAPTATLPGAAADGTVSDALYLVPALVDAAGSSGSLVVSAMTLDGAAWNVARPIDAATLSLGQHVLTVTARDNAGNTSTTTITFTTVASYAGLSALVDRYTASGVISTGTASTLERLLAQAEAATSDSRERAALNQFSTRVRADVRSTGVRTLLLRDAAALLAAPQA